MQTEEANSFVKAYEETLSQLTSAVKHEINGLTMLAEDNREYAISIASCIENQLKTAPNDRKLPILYLIDSICKNCKNTRYVELFTQNIVSNFCNVYKSASESVRRGLLKLRKSWADPNMKIFPQSKLDAIDERVRKIDPNWPSTLKDTSQQYNTRQTANSASSNQIKPAAQDSNQKSMSSNNDINVNSSNNNNVNNNINTRSGVKRAVTNNGKRNKRPRINGSQPTSQAQLQPQQQLPLELQPQLHSHIQQQPQPLPFMTIPQAQPQQALPFIGIPPLQPISQIPAQMQPPPTIPIIAIPPPPQPPQIIQAPSEEKSDPILISLYERKQCSSCCLRFDDNDPNYAAHLDWHYNQNSTTGTEVARRKFYYPIYLWTNDDDQKPVDTETPHENVEPDDYSVQKALAPDDEEKNKCSVCHEKFDKEWCESDEEWKLLNALMHGDEFFHPSCFKDVVQKTLR